MAGAQKLKYVPPKASVSHFLASSFAAWRSNDDLMQLIQDMTRDGLPFRVWLVPLPLDSEYEINNYTPQVPGCCYIGQWDRIE